MMQRALGDAGLRRLPGRARRARRLHAHRRAGRRDPADDARPVGQPGAGKARRRVSRSCSTRSPSTCGSCPTRRTSWAIIRDDLLELKQKHGDERRTEISGEEIGDDRPGRPDHRRDDGGHDQPPAATSSARRPAPIGPSAAAARGSRGPRPRKKIRSSTCSSPARTTTCCSSRTSGKVYWQKVYDLPQLSRESRGRAIVNLLNLAEGEKIADCRADPRFRRSPDHLPDDGHAQGAGEEDGAGRSTAGR